MLTLAILGRILHYSIIVNINGESFGLEYKRNAGLLVASIRTAKHRTERLAAPPESDSVGVDQFYFGDWSEGWVYPITPDLPQRWVSFQPTLTPGERDAGGTSGVRG